MNIACPVCDYAFARPFLTVGSAAYWRCPRCLATFLDRAQLPDRETEDARYRQHQNEVQDQGYRTFLNKLAAPLLARLPAAQVGLDYGCGPGPALAAMLTEAGHRVALYDPLFWPDREVLTYTYDFVTSTEVVEHFHQPAREFVMLTHLVRPGGWLGIQTCFQTDDARFAHWHYRQDPTHVTFYRAETFIYLAQQWGWRWDIPHKDVVLLQKPEFS